jgi:hypothetical protein
LNEAQAIFTLFFAISWGIVSNLLPHWKPFHYAMWWRRGFWQPTRRILAAFTILNLIPPVFFVVILICLRGDALTKDEWTLAAAFLLIPRAILSGLVPFGSYHLWIAMIQQWPTFFYAKNQQAVPEGFRVPSDSAPNEPDVESLHLRSPGAPQNFCFGVIYLAFGLLALIPGTK